MGQDLEEWLDSGQRCNRNYWDKKWRTVVVVKSECQLSSEWISELNALWCWSTYADTLDMTHFHNSGDISMGL